MSIDAIGNFLTVMRNALRVSHKGVSVPHSKIKEQIAIILKQEGFIKDFSVTTQDKKSFLNVEFRYFRGESAIHQITRISTPGLRVYQGSKEFKHIAGNFGMSIVSTSKGVMTNKEATKLNVGGEVLCSIW